MICIIIGWFLLNIAAATNLYFDGVTIEGIFEILVVINTTIIGLVCIFKGLFS